MRSRRYIIDCQRVPLGGESKVNRNAGAIGAVLFLFAGMNAAFAQRGSDDWSTAANDAQRSSWVRNDGKISPASMAKPGFKLSWKMKFDNQPRQLNTLTPPSLLGFYIGYRGFRALGFFGASSDKIIAVDTELGRLEWQNKYPPAADSAGTPDCPGGLTASVIRPTGTDYPPMPTGQGSGRGSPAKSGVGAPHEGSVVLAALASRPVPVRRPQPTKPAAPSPFAPHVQVALALTGDGKLHTFWVSNGHEPSPAVPFIPANANALGLIAYGDSAYVATTNSCGEAGNGLWGVNLTTAHVSHWKSTSPIAGTAGPAVGPDGTLYAAAGNELVALSPKNLEPMAVYKSPGAAFSSTPVVFEHNGRDLLAVASDDGRIHLLDTARLNGDKALAISNPISAPGYPAGSLTSWQDPAGTRWILAAGDGVVVAMKVVEKNGAPALQRAWKSPEMVSPLAPVVVNGVVFALSSGEFRSGDPKISAAERANRSKHAVLYALDGLTGKELWNSGDTITSFVHSGGLAAGGSRVYVATYEGTQYAFGFPIEH